MNKTYYIRISTPSRWVTMNAVSEEEMLRLKEAFDPKYFEAYENSVEPKELDTLLTLKSLDGEIEYMTKTVVDWEMDIIRFNKTIDKLKKLRHEVVQEG